MLRVLLKLILLFCVKQPSADVNSVCYSFYGEEAMDLPSSEEVQVLRIYRNYLIEQLPGFQRDYGSVNPVKARDVLEEMQAEWTTNELVLKLESGKAFAEFNPIWEEAGR